MKAFVNTVRIKAADLEDEFLFQILAAFRRTYNRCRERPQIAMYFLEWLGRLKWRATGLDASLSFFSTSRRCSRNRSPSRLPVSPMYNLLHNVQVMQ